MKGNIHVQPDKNMFPKNFYYILKNSKESKMVKKMTLGYRWLFNSYKIMYNNVRNLIYVCKALL